MYRYYWLLYFENNFFNANFNYLIIKQLRWKKCFFLSYVVMLKLSKSLFFIFLIAKKNYWLIFNLGNSIPIYDENLKNGKSVITKILIFSCSSSKLCQKNTRNYVFDVKFSAENDPGVRKNHCSRKAKDFYGDIFEQLLIII